MEIKKMKHKFSFMLCPLTLLIHQTIYASPQINQLDTISVLGTSESKAEAGKDKMFSENQVTEYKSKKEIETYKGHSVADLLTGTTGVYSGDARNSGALDPNIRGVQGQGRIPVLVDGTEQAITVWRGFAGVSNRNYLDPFLISSVTVEKGPNLNRTLDSGAAGTIRLSTLEPDDIIKKGEKFGIEFKAETANNSIKQRGYPIPIGQDFRKLNQPEDMGLGPISAYFRTSDRYPARSHGRNKFFNDNAYRLAIATKDEHFEGLVAYAYRNKGNYFAGSKGGHNYGEGKTLDEYANQENFDPNYYSTDDPYIPWIAIVYHPKKEVPNTSFESESYLGKATIKFNDHTKLKFGLRHSDMHYGEIMPSRLWQTSYQQGTVLQWPLANVKQTAVNTDFEYNPENNKWVNLRLGAYAVFNHAKTNTSGGSPSDIIFDDMGFNSVGTDLVAPEIKQPGEEGYEQYLIDKAEYIKQIRKKWKEYANSNDKTPNIKGVFDTKEAQAQWSKDNHYGVYASNRFEVTPKLNFDVMSNYKWENLNSENEFTKNTPLANEVCGGWVGSGKPDSNIYCPGWDYHMSGERHGKRKELNVGFNFQYSPVDWLVLDAGAKYTHYKSRDDGLRKQIQDKQREEVLYPAAIRFDYRELPNITEDMIKKYNNYKNFGIKEAEFKNEFSKNNPEPKRSNYNTEEEWLKDRRIWSTNRRGYVNSKLIESNLSKPTDEDSNIAEILEERNGLSGEEKTIYWERDQYGNFNLDNSPINKYFTDDKLKEEQFNPATNQTEKTIQYISANFSQLEKRNPTEEQWEKMKKAKRTAHAWAPAFGATVLVTDNIRIYARYTETKRMPSIFEDTIGYSITELHPFYDRKPEHSKNIEIGYVQDLRGLLPNARRADIRLNYFHNLTKNVFDRDVNYEMKQFDKRMLSGLEFQTRYDQGNFFADLGIVYNLKNKFCDKNSAVLDRGIWDYVRNVKKPRALPECVNGGNAEGYLKHTIAPKYSITANLGIRALDERLELGTRWLYHSQVKDSRAKSLRDAGFLGSTETNRWNPVLVVDAYASYKVNENLQLELVGTNITDRYYLDPLTRSSMPAPGRTIKLGFTAKF